MNREASTARNDTAFRAKHMASPSQATKTPPRAAPKTRAMLSDTEFKVTALEISSGGTSSAMKLCRAGLSNTLTQPSASASR